VQADAESVEQRKLGPISDLVARRIASQREVQTDDGTPCTQVADVHLRNLAALESAQLGVRGSRGRGTRAKAQAAGDSCVVKVAPKTPAGFARTPSATIARSVTGTHRRESWMVTLHWRSPADGLPIIGFCSARRHKGPVARLLAVGWFAKRNEQPLRAGFRADLGRPSCAAGHLVRCA
jgi:hypothetical protein